MSVNQSSQSGVVFFLLVLLFVGAAFVLLLAKPTTPISVNMSAAPQAANQLSIQEQVLKGEATEAQILGMHAYQSASEITLNTRMPAMTVAQLEAAVPGIGAQVIPGFPDWDQSDWLHAAESRGSMLKVLLAYELVRFSANELYCGTTPYRTGPRCVVIARDPFIGAVAMIFDNAGTPEVPVFGRAVTIIFNSSKGASIDQVRFSSCASIKVMPLPVAYEKDYDPPPTGFGRCLQNN